ncbi:heme peroxidase family protein [Rhizobiaceae bacterium]|nr:heme peroxidase family protein [Rhizobiaceae bacterium]
MLFSLGHGQRIIVTPPPATESARSAKSGAMVGADMKSYEAVAGSDTHESVGGSGMPAIGGPFAYMFPNAAGPAHDDTILDRLSTLADAMVEQPSQIDDPALDGAIPPIFTYFGQFIDHDITANTDRDVASSQIGGPNLTPVPRGQVVTEIKNLRKGSLGLDSLYGDGPAQDAFARKLEAAMRHPTLKGKMRLDTAIDIGGTPDLPADPAVDLLRLGRLVDRGTITQADIDALPADMREGFVNDDGTPYRQKAIIGDGRNDENLIVAQLQVAWLRFHNKCVDWIAGRPGAPTSSDALFAQARKLVRWHYQWLVVNEFLPTICDPDIVAEVKAAQAPTYSAFYDTHAGASAEHMPMPLEFSVAAYRYGHTMVRGRYDYNANFGRGADGSDFGNRAGFAQLFQFTGRGHDPLFGFDRLPSNWIIEWERFVRDAPAFPDRTARAIDPLLAPPLKDMLNEPAGVFKHLAERNLRRGHRLNIPIAQACIDAFGGGAKGDGYYPSARGSDCKTSAIEPLSEAELTSGATGQAIRDGGFVEQTPLWFYVLKEAEIKGRNGRMGQLGSRLIAETLIGLVLKDPSSYWHESGADHADGVARWHPSDGAQPDGEEVTSLAALLRATGQLGIAPPLG